MQFIASTVLVKVLLLITVARDGGVIRTYDSLFNIICSTFSNNSAAYYCNSGVMITYGGSSFNITYGTFTNNNAADTGGVMYTFDSIFKITSSIFANNSATKAGGVTFSSDTSFNITSSIFTK